MRSLQAVLAVLAIVLASCGDGDTPVASGDGPGTSTTRGEPAPADEPVEYRSVSVTEHGEPRPLVDGTVISLRLAPGTIGASLGCNSIGGDHQLVDGVLVVEALHMTEMACEPPLMDQDRWFVELLQDRPTLAVEGDTLVLATDTTTVTFRERSAVDPDRSLEGTAWTATGFVDGDVATSFPPAPGREHGHLRLDPGTSTATGSDGCNAFSVPYEVDGGQLRFGELTGDDADCQGTDEYEERFRAVLGGTVDWEITADSLTLTAADGRGVTYVASE